MESDDRPDLTSDGWLGRIGSRFPFRLARRNSRQLISCTL